MCVLVNQAIHTVNEVHQQAPLDFAVLGGDNVDNVQSNELDWVMNILDGTGKVKCDSGNPDDPVAGPANDGKDEFTPEGLKVPWYWVMGNHDVNQNGNVPIVLADGTADPSAVTLATGTTASSGTRLYSSTGWTVTTGTVVADAKRTPLMRKDMLQRVHDKVGGPGPAGRRTSWRSAGCACASSRSSSTSSTPTSCSSGAE